jgi:3-O-methylgallate 3,4-dioxygenase
MLMYPVGTAAEVCGDRPGSRDVAKIVLGLGTSHSPMLNLTADIWDQRAQEDQRNPMLYRVPDGAHVTYDQLMDTADPAVLKELTPEVFERRHEANQKGIEAVADVFEKANPDVLVMVGDDQHEVFQDDNMPAVGIYYGEQVPYFPRKMREGHTMGTAMAFYPQEAMAFPCANELALHMINSMCDQDIDVAHSKYFREGQSVGHAFVFVYHRIMRGRPIPTVLVLQNTYYPPAQPSPKRSYQYGVAIRNAIESWPGNERVAVLATGGLSHFVVDEELDRKVLKAFKEKDDATLKSLPKERLQAGTSEIRNWLTVAGAAEHLDFDLLDYVPCYRSPAGTGCAMGFARWA